MTHTTPLIFLPAGEASGDWLGAGLATALKHINPAIQLTGMGGPQMLAAGVTLQANAMDLAIIGLNGLFTQLGTIRRLFRAFTTFFETQKPDLVILIDYPGFNLRLAKRAKAAGCRVLYYVSPQLWAWHYSRVNAIRKTVDHMAVLLPLKKNYMIARTFQPRLSGTLSWIS
jgi:lipid-A-disaccharide synthase